MTEGMPLRNLPASIENPSINIDECTINNGPRTHTPDQIVTTSSDADVKVVGNSRVEVPQLLEARMPLWIVEVA